MATFEIAGATGGLIIYTDDNNEKIRVVIAQIITYSRGRSGYIDILTAKEKLAIRPELKSKSNNSNQPVR